MYDDPSAQLLGELYHAVSPDPAPANAVASREPNTNSAPIELNHGVLASQQRNNNTNTHAQFDYFGDLDADDSGEENEPAPDPSQPPNDYAFGAGDSQYDHTTQDGDPVLPNMTAMADEFAASRGADAYSVGDEHDYAPAYDHNLALQDRDSQRDETTVNDYFLGNTVAVANWDWDAVMEQQRQYQYQRQHQHQANCSGSRGASTPPGSPNGHDKAMRDHVRAGPYRAEQMRDDFEGEDEDGMGSEDGSVVSHSSANGLSGRNGGEYDDEHEVESEDGSIDDRIGAARPQDSGNDTDSSENSSDTGATSQDVSQVLIDTDDSHPTPILPVDEIVKQQKADKALHIKALGVLPHALPPSRYWVAILHHTVAPRDVRKEKDFLWIKANRVRTVIEPFSLPFRLL